MKSYGARGIARVSANPQCHAQSAMILLGLREEQLFEILTGRPDPASHGERTTAMRQGRLFDAHLAKNNAAALLQALDGHLGIDPTTAVVRDLRREVPGDSVAAQHERQRRTQGILADLVSGRPIPDLVLQAVLRLPIGTQHGVHIVPDGLVLDRSRGMFLPLEGKSYIAVDGRAEPGDRNDIRSQAAVQIHALQAELSRLGAGGRVTIQAFLVLASPFGLRPMRAVLEELPAEVAAVNRALRTYVATAGLLRELRRSSSLGESLRRLSTHYQEGCLTSCGLAEVCKQRAPGLRGQFGDLAEHGASSSLDMPRVVALLDGDAPKNHEEVARLASLAETATLFGWGR